MEAGREPRLGDVAERSGVSVATVSRVLNNRGYLSAATRERVSKAIEELDYRPNQVARSLLSQRTGTAGLIVPTVALPFYGEVAVGVGVQAEEGLQQGLIRPQQTNLLVEHGRRRRQADLARLGGKFTRQHPQQCGLA